MPLRKQVILAPTAEADQSEVFEVLQGRPVSVVMHAALGITAAQYGDLQVSHNGAAWQDVFQGGSQVRLSSTNNTVLLEAPGEYRIDKEATTNPVGLTVIY